jgi:hypothetical protein
MLEVIIPATRNPSRLIQSLAYGSVRPDLVTVVSNEFHPKSVDGLPVRTLRFTSEEYCYGESDVVLRRNIGIWEAEGDLLLFQDDDQIAPVGMVEAVLARLEVDDFVFGHHRFIDFTGWKLEALMEAPPEAGAEREHPPNHEHLWQSCYAGMFGIRTELIRRHQGFDMMFLGRHAGEDQNLGRRLLLERATTHVFIWEPPFAWHPIKSSSRRPTATNSCGDHRLDFTTTNGVLFQTCSRCPYYEVAEPKALFGNSVVLPYDPALVSITKEIP